jgi:hypothetical protein
MEGNQNKLLSAASINVSFEIDIVYP